MRDRDHSDASDVRRGFSARLARSSREPRGRGDWLAAGRVLLRRRPAVGALAVFAALLVMAVSAAACEGVGGPPSSPPEEETKGKCNEADPNLTNLCTGDPVNNATGDLTEEQTDLSIGGRGPGLRIVRTYDSSAAAKASTAGPWGFGWTGPYDASLEVNSTEGKATVHQEGGNSAVFYKSGSEYTQGGWTEARLVVSGSNYVYTLPDQSQLEFNSSGQLVKETDRNGNSNTLTYSGGHLEKVTDGDSRTLTFAYNGTGQVEKVTDPMKHVISYTYSSENLASVAIEGKTRWEFTYESPHLLTKIKDGRGHTTTNEYEGTTHRVSKQTIAGHERKFKYGTNETTVTEPNGSETAEKFNVAGEPTAITRAKGKSEETTTEYEYNATTYALTKLIDPNKHVTEYGYDSEGNKISEKDPNNDEKKWEYDKKHNIIKETTPESETTTIKRNTAGEPEVIERPIESATQKTEYKYTEKGELSEEIDPLGHTTKYTYDAAGDRESETDPEGNERKWKYNEDSQVIEETSPRKFTTKTERDEQGWPIKVTDPLGHTTKYTYDGDGNVESETDGNGHTTEYFYNEENLPTEVKEANGNETKTEYDAEGKMTVHTDGNGHKWEYKRNALEQVTEEKNPLGKIWKKEYEKAGNLKTLEDPEKHTTEYKYDESNRLSKVKYSTGKPSEVTYEYSKDSKVTKMTDGTGTTKSTYDKLDRLTESENGAKKVVKYEYNLANEPTVITYPNKEKVTRSYDKDNRLEKVKDWKSNETTFSYNPDSELEKATFPTSPADKDKYTYNEADQLTEVEMNRETEKLATLAYERDKDGQVKKTTATGLPGAASGEDTYDNANRLTEANTHAYEYDKANNPTKIEGSGTYSYNAADELEKAPAITYAYNEDGERTEAAPTKGPAITYGYDQVGNLTSVKRTETTEKPKIEDTFTYDGNNLRQSQDINGATTNLTWDTAEGLPIVLSDETNSYIYGPENLPVEQISSSGSTILYYHHDQQGSTRLLTGTTGKTEAVFTYNPYGTLNKAEGKTEATPLLYDAQYTTNSDTGAELIYLRARTYDPNTAEFLSVDPVLETTGEPYIYTKDNPENHSDVTGECSQEPTKEEICAEIKAAILALDVQFEALQKKYADDIAEIKGIEDRLNNWWGWLLGSPPTPAEQSRLIIARNTLKENAANTLEQYYKVANSFAPFDIAAYANGCGF
jgi:RHS repeat-associated protein